MWYLRAHQAKCTIFSTRRCWSNIACMYGTHVSIAYRHTEADLIHTQACRTFVIGFSSKQALSGTLPIYCLSWTKSSISQLISRPRVWPSVVLMFKLLTWFRTVVLYWRVYALYNFKRTVLCPMLSVLAVSGNLSTGDDLFLKLVLSVFMLFFSTQS
jgi:hypothetical protein